MKFAIAAAVATLAAPGVASAATEVWKIEADVSGFAYQLTCTLEIADGKLSGPCVSNLDPTPIQTAGTYGDGKTEFAYDVNFAGQDLHVVYKGESQPDGSVKGTVDASGNTGVFTAKK